MDNIDWKIWERLYGRELSALERIEIKNNLSYFFNVLISEDAKQKRNALFDEIQKLDFIISATTDRFDEKDALCHSKSQSL